MQPFARNGYTVMIIMSIQMKTATADNFTMNYFTFGKGDKTFVILPGLSVQSVMGAAAMIAKAYESIAREYTVYVFDRRNELPTAYSVYDMADDTAAVFRALGLKEVYLFGASQGGMIAMTMAIKHPELVQKLMLGSSSARITDEQFNALSEWIDLAKKKDRVQLNLAMGRVLYPEALFEQYRELLKKTAERITDEELARFICFAEGTKGFDVAEMLHTIACPILSLGAADDKVLPDSAQELERLLAGKQGFESYLYHGYGHAAFDTAPDYKERLLRFMKK